MKVKRKPTILRPLIRTLAAIYALRGASIAAIIACSFLLFSPTVRGQTPGDATADAGGAGGDAVNLKYEYNVKAAFLYSFGRYIEWPANTFANKETPFVIGVFGENPFGDTLGHIAKTKTIQDRRIEVRKIESPDGIAACQILFIPRAVAPDQQRKLIDKAAGKPILLVGEIQDFADRGGNVNFYIEGTRVRFEINVDSIRREKLQIDAKLLTLGKKTH
jgi:hypothetical protein